MGKEVEPSLMVKRVDGTGIEPDVEVELPEGATTDVQLEKAKEVLKEKLQ